MRQLIYGGAIVAVAIAGVGTAARAQAPTEPRSSCVANCGDANTVAPRLRTVEMPPPRPGAISSIARRDAIDLNNQAVDVMKDWDYLDRAQQMLERAVQLDPSDATIAANLRDVRNAISMKKSRAQAMTVSVDAAITSLATALRNGQGLDFTKTWVMPSSNLQFGSSSIVDARAVASGLPAGTDRAIADLYGKAPAGVSDRVRKGFQAVMVRDWNVARAWFEDALLRDPSNPGLKKLIEAVNRPAPTPATPRPEVRAKPSVESDPLGFLLEGIVQEFVEELDDLIKPL